MDDLEYIRQNILAARKKKLAQKEMLVPPEERSSFLAVFLSVCILLVSLASIAAMFILMQDNNLSKEDTVMAEEESPADNSWGLKIDLLEKRLVANEYRIWILSLANNENANISSKYHRGSQNITIDENWKLNRIPTTMGLTEEQKKYLESGPSK